MNVEVKTEKGIAYVMVGNQIYSETWLGLGRCENLQLEQLDRVNLDLRLAHKKYGDKS